VKIAEQPMLVGVPASAVRGVWLRQGPPKKYDRVLWLEREAAATGGSLTERVAKLLARHQRRPPTPSSTSRLRTRGTSAARAPNSSGRLRRSSSAWHTGTALYESVQQ
jgi:hypothetical protein